MGGSILRPLAHPSLALITYQGTISCGGTVVGPKHVLTAAHCLEDIRSLTKLAVLLGVHDRLITDDHVRKHSVKGVIIHEKYQVLEDNMLINDIALLQLDRIEFNQFIKPICLPFNVDVSHYKAAAVAGWGRTEYAGMTSRMPRVTLVSLLTTSQCQKSSISQLLSKIPSIYKMVLCAYKRDSDACQGDSGGPLYVKKDDEIDFQIGIVSFGVKCGTPGMPGLYTRLAHYLAWVDKHLDGAHCRVPPNH